MAGSFWKSKAALVLGALVVGAGIGVVAVGVTTEMVHWSSSNEFCGEACHSMTWVKEAYERGPHARTKVGVTAGCADCHIPYESGHANPFQYIALMAFKAKAGARDVYHEALGTMNTKEKWESERPRLTKQVEEWIAGNNSLTCRGCHELDKFSGKDNPMVVELHAGVLKGDKINCLECHQGVGHVYEPKTKTSAAPAAAQAN